MTAIDSAHIGKARSYAEYMDMTDKLLQENKTTGPDQSEKMVEYTKLNRVRISRLEKQTKILPELAEALQKLEKEYYWIMLVEAWCGDVAQILPIVRKVIDAAPTIELLLLLRDENPEIMDSYLTGGSRSIPKLICLEKDSLKEVWNWGPRPAPAQEMMYEWKKNPVGDKAEFTRKMQEWYLEDKGKTIQQELLDLVKKLS